MAGTKRRDGRAAETGAKRLKVVESPRACCINHSYTSGPILSRLRECWRESLSFDDTSTSAELLNAPFQCCVLPNFVSASPSTGSGCSDGVDASSAMDSGITGLGACPSRTAAPSNGVDSGAGHNERPEAKATSSGDIFLKDLVLELLKLKFYEKNNDLYQFHQSDDLKKFKSPCVSSLRSMFKKECLPWLRKVTGLELTDTIDMTCSKYEYTDILLCHDDELESRRIAFILYLVPEWSAKDGGSLDLFNTDALGQPGQVVRSLLPLWNTMVFFDVNAKSFHQVAEVLSANKTRLSINGWFHGPPAPRPTPYKPHPLPLSPPISLGLESLSEWVEPMYLDVGVQKQIQLQFEEDSQIQLPNFLMEEKYKMLCEELSAAADSSSKWSREGPPNRKCTLSSVPSSLTPLSRTFSELLVSKPFLLLLAHMTELELVDDVIKIGDSDLNCDDVSKEGAANSATDPNTAGTATSLPGPELSSSALCRAEVCQWHHGNYTLAGDLCDPGLGRFCLEANISFNSEEWCEEFGGTVSYIASEEDEEFLTVCPTANSLSLVYRDKDLLRFTKYINHRSLSTSNGCHQTISATYIEHTQDKE